MAFVNKDGKKLSQKDILLMGQIYSNFMVGLSDQFDQRMHYCRDKKFYIPIVEQFKISSVAFLENFKKAAESEEEFKIEEFYDREMLKFSNDLRSKADPNARDMSMFESTILDQFTERFGGAPKAKDTFEGLEKTMSSFKLATKPMEGVERIDDIDPFTIRPIALSEVRKSNSNTNGELQGRMDEAAQMADAIFVNATEIARSKAVYLADKKRVTFGDLFDTFCTINSTLRPNDRFGGSIRAEDVEAGKIQGISSVSIPGHIFRTLDKVADYMNQIKQTRDRNLQKTQAIQLASFVYQMSVSEHIFQDGNGRSCRLFADSILQSFGLPPHTPSIALTGTGATIGTELDFENGARLFKESVLVSDELMKLEKITNPKDLGKMANAYLASEHMKPVAEDYMSPREAINVAIQSRLNKHSMAEALMDFIKADHLFTNNSDEYDAVIQKGIETLTVLSKEPLNSAKSQKVMKELDTCIEKYDRHCQDHPKKNNATRQARQKSVFALGTALFYARNSVQYINSIEKKSVLRNVEKIQNELADGSNPKLSTKENLAKFAISRYVEKEMTSRDGKLAIDKADSALKMHPQTIKKIMNSNMFQEAINEVGTDKAMSGKTNKELFTAISDKFIKKIDDHVKQLKAQKQNELNAKKAVPTK